MRTDPHDKMEFDEEGTGIFAFQGLDDDGDEIIEPDPFDDEESL